MLELGQNINKPFSINILYYQFYYYENSVLITFIFLYRQA